MKCERLLFAHRNEYVTFNHGKHRTIAIITISTERMCEYKEEK